MQKIFVAFLLTLTSLTYSFGQILNGTVIYERFLAPSIVGNPANESAVRRNAG